jgi:CubicO group peptidase (beta-lactamase class C family)
MIKAKRRFFTRKQYVQNKVAGLLHFTAPLCGFILACVTISSCGGTVKQADKKNADTAIIALSSPTAIPSAELDRYRQACESWFDSMLKRTGFNGGILVAKKGNVVFEAYNGTGHLQSNDTITANTPFHIASVSKTFTAMAVLKLKQDGKLNLDDEYVKYFPTFNYPGVTIRTLLNHRSGLPNYVHFMEKLGWDKDKYISNQDVFDYLVNLKAQLTDIGRPNTRFTYCNTNYALLALLIEKLSGQKYPQFMQQTFFKPLQMNHTFVFDTSMLKTVNPSYDWRGQLIPFGFLDAVYGDKNIYSTPQDLLTWDKMLYSGKIFTDSSLTEAFAPYSNEKPGIRNYGLGWRMNIYPNNKKMLYHNGWWHGNNASFIRLLDDGATIIVVGNKFNRNIYHAKDMTALFGNYGNGMEEEEESNNDAKKPADAAVKKKRDTAPAKGAIKKQASAKKKGRRK